MREAKVERMDVTVYVPSATNAEQLLPVGATAAGEGNFRLEAPVPADAAFQAGEIVECEYRAVGDKRELVVTASLTRDPEWRSRKRVYAVCGFLVGFLLGFAFTWDILENVKVIGVALISATVFAWASVRYGDRAWRGIGRMLDGL